MMTHCDPRSVSTQPNVLWISMEDTSPRFGCYGDEVARTPNIDALAESGRRYPNAFATAPVCAPSRSAAVTGCYQNSLGTHHMRTTHTNDDAPGLATPYDAVPPHYVRTVSEFFRQAGYYCTNNVKTDYQFGEPFTAWDEHHDEAGWWGRDDDQPFFAAFNNTVTHESGMWPPAERAELAGEAIEALPTGGSLSTDPDAVSVPPYLADTEATRNAIARQYENIHAADAWIGDLLDRLDADGLAENTIVVLWSDHGEGLPRAKRWPYDSGINVPLLVRWPGEVDGGTVSDELVSMVDLAPTLLAACGLDVPRHMEGQPFLGEDATEREYVYAARDRYDESHDMIRVVRGQRYKYVRNYYPGQPYRQWIPFRNRHPAMVDLLRRDAADELDGAESWVAARRPAEELYDLGTDPHETENLIDDPDHADARDRLRTALDEWLDRVDEYAAEDETAMTRRRHGGAGEPTTATPTFVPNAPGNREREATPEGTTLDGPATVSIHCSTQGASVGYTTESGPDPHWRLYTGPISLSAGETTLRAKAIRYGFAESDEREATFTVSD